MKFNKINFYLYFLEKLLNICINSFIIKWYESKIVIE